MLPLGSESSSFHARNPRMKPWLYLFCMGWKLDLTLSLKNVADGSLSYIVKQFTVCNGLVAQYC